MHAIFCKVHLSQKHAKVISSKSQRRRKVVNCGAKRMRRSGKDIDFLPIIIEEVYVPSLVSVKPEEEWLCSPSVATVIYKTFYFMFLLKI